ncbi:hypothetical protein A2U01_0094276, partial [Trifolium medium]|nr:hypothetical protein [Trifolium medium]
EAGVFGNFSWGKICRAWGEIANLFYYLEELRHV